MQYMFYPYSLNLTKQCPLKGKPNFSISKQEYIIHLTIYELVLLRLFSKQPDSCPNCRFLVLSSGSGVCRVFSPPFQLAMATYDSSFLYTAMSNFYEHSSTSDRLLLSLFRASDTGVHVNEIVQRLGIPRDKIMYNFLFSFAFIILLLVTYSICGLRPHNIAPLQFSNIYVLLHGKLSGLQLRLLRLKVTPTQQLMTITTNQLATVDFSMSRLIGF